MARAHILQPVSRRKAKFVPSWKVRSSSKELFNHARLPHLNISRNSSEDFVTCFGARKGQAGPVDMAVESGMSNGGVPSDEDKVLAEQAKTEANAAFKGMFYHLSVRSYL